jgi:hypothetical protein
MRYLVLATDYDGTIATALIPLGIVHSGLFACETRRNDTAPTGPKPPIAGTVTSGDFKAEV